MSIHYKRTAYIHYLKNIVNIHPQFVDNIFNMVLCDDVEFFIQISLMVDDINDAASINNIIKIMKECGMYQVPLPLKEKVLKKAEKLTSDDN